MSSSCVLVFFVFSWSESIFLQFVPGSRLSKDVVRTFRSAVSGRPEGLHYAALKSSRRARPSVRAFVAANCNRTLTTQNVFFVRLGVLRVFVVRVGLFPVCSREQAYLREEGCPFNTDEEGQDGKE